MKPSNDREAISLIIDGLIERGCKPTASRDGDSEDLPYTDKESALDWLTSCDESVLFVDLPLDAASEHTSSHIYFVLGNDPEEVACDYGVSLSPYLDPITNPWWE
jgi:hypothetical protein